MLIQNSFAVALSLGLLTTVSLGLPGTLTTGAPSAGTPSADGPSLVVLIVVDQLRADLVTHYGPALTGGFARLRERGLRFSNMTHDHAMTETSPGHASVSTGTYPSKHGMVRNVWWEREGTGM